MNQCTPVYHRHVTKNVGGMQESCGATVGWLLLLVCQGEEGRGLRLIRGTINQLECLLVSTVGFNKILLDR